MSATQPLRSFPQQSAEGPDPQQHSMLLGPLQGGSHPPPPPASHPLGLPHPGGKGGLDGRFGALVYHGYVIRNPERHSHRHPVPPAWPPRGEPINGTVPAPPAGILGYPEILHRSTARLLGPACPVPVLGEAIVSQPVPGTLRYPEISRRMTDRPNSFPSLGTPNSFFLFLFLMYFGACERPGCSYGHEAARVFPGKRNAIVQNMTKAMADFLAADSSEA